MNEYNRDIIGEAYQSFSNRDIDHILSFMHPNTNWPKAWEGEYVQSTACH